MDANPVDPRFIESEHPAIYHVYFWSDGRRRSHEYELTGAADVHEVLRWADSNAAGREIEVLAVIGTQATYLVGPLDHSSPVA
ncbi:MAG TPA: hypothetical protein VIM27_08230 [Gaiellales bacterium]|jgi:hypothetical protein